MKITPAEFLAFFPPGRMDCFGFHDGRRASVVKKPLDEFVVRQHLAGKARIGFFPLNDKGCVRWACIDLDDAGVSPVIALVRKAREWGLTFAVERSKSKGHHLWLFFSEWTSAAKVRQVLKGMLVETGWAEHWDFEIFPKQAELADGAYGNYLFMPWQGQSVKEGRTVFVDMTKDQWPPWPDQGGFLREMGCLRNGN